MLSKLIEDLIPLWDMADAFYRYLTGQVCHALVLFSIHKFWCHQNRTYC